MHLDKNPSDTSLSRGTAALKAGRKAEAERLLKLAVGESPDSAEAWLWLAAAVSSPGETLFCLERVLKLDPGNQKAMSGIGWVRDQHAPAELVACDPLAIDPRGGSCEAGSLPGDSTFVVDNVQDPAMVTPGRPAVGANLARPALAESESTNGHFFPKLLIAGLCLTLLLGILIIVALLRAWLG